MIDIGDQSIYTCLFSAQTNFDFDLIIYLLSAFAQLFILFIHFEGINKHFAFPNNAKQNEIFLPFFVFFFFSDVRI